MDIDKTDTTGAVDNPIVLGGETVEEPNKETNQPEVVKQVQVKQQTCPYIGTIDRKALDFDFEKLCSVSLSKVNVYACLICGKYFQGRGRSTHAFIHSVSEFHHVFLNLETHKFYCLPDNYEINDSSLDDILYVLRPTFEPSQVEQLDNYDKPVKAYDGKLYYPGIVGLNNLKFNDYCNVIFQALSHVPPLRNHFLLEANYSPGRGGDERYLLYQRFGELLRKLWNPRNFKAHVSPHEMLQAIISSSKKKFEFTKQSDPILFLSWFLNSLLGPKREKSSIIKRTFQGKIEIATRLLLPNVTASSSNEEPELIPSAEEKFDVTSFLYLTLDLPSMPLFPKKDEKGKVIKPRVSIYELLSKFDENTKHEFRGYRESSVKRYRILKLPKYLILYFKRFTRNTFFTEKNTHLVDFPLNALKMSHFKQDKSSNTQDTSSGHHQEQSQDVYTLIANIVHDGEPDAGKGTYRAHIFHRGTGKWYEMQDLYVTEMADTTLITLSESYIQIWERKGA